MVETTNFNGQESVPGASENMKVTERFTRIADDAIDYKFTVEDPTTWDKAWTAEAPLAKTEGPIFEFACHETNYGIPNILAGARAEEKRRPSRQRRGRTNMRAKLVVVIACAAVLLAVVRCGRTMRSPPNSM